MNTAVFQFHTGFCSAPSNGGTAHVAMSKNFIFARHALCVCLFLLCVGITLLILVPVSIIYIIMLIVVGVIVRRANCIPDRTQR